MRPCRPQKNLLIALLLVLSMLGAEFLSMAHQVTSRHFFCFAHGHLVDADEPEPLRKGIAAASDSSEPGETASPSGVLRALSFLAERLRHSHCDKTVFLRVGEYLDPPLSSSVPPVQSAAPDSFPAEFSQSGIDLLFLAPKNSPPLSS